jgi:DNA-binding transcriptional regulator of glucitol operon
MTRRRWPSIVAVVVLTWVFAWLLGHIHWPDQVGIAVSHLSGMMGGIGIEDTEDLFLILILIIAFLLALAMVMAIGRWTRRTRA